MRRPYNPPEPRVIAIAATKKIEKTQWLLWGAYTLGAISLYQHFFHQL